MKVEPVVSNNDELFIANITQNNKIKFLEAEKSKRELYIRDLQESLMLNKESLSAIAEGSHSLCILKMKEENTLLHAKLQKYYDEYMNSNALLLIEQQLRAEEKKFYNERILDFETNMIELRKYLQDKEESFATVVNRLKKYEDLSEVTLETKLHKFSEDLKEDSLYENIKKLSEERDRYKQVCEKMGASISTLSTLKACLQKKQSFEVLQNAYANLSLSSEKEEKGRLYQQTKCHTNGSISTKKQQPVSTGASNVKNPNKQLIKLLKKQRLNNEILQQALNEAIEKNQQLLMENSTLIQANQLKQLRIQKLQSKGYLLQQQLTKKDRSLAWDQKWKSKCDMDRQARVRQFEQKGEQDQICLYSMQEDMELLSSFILTCVPRGSLVKSSSNPNLSAGNEEPVEGGQQYDIEQI